MWLTILSTTGRHKETDSKKEVKSLVSQTQEEEEEETAEGQLLQSWAVRVRGAQTHGLFYSNLSP